MSDTIKHSPELAAACQYVNDLRIKKALQESSMLVLLTEEFSSSDFTELVQSIADVGKLLPKEMQNSREAFQTAVESALKTKAKLNRGSVTKEQFAKEVAQLAGLGSALGSVVADLKNIALLRDATSMQQEADVGVSTLGTELDDVEKDLVKSAIEDSFRPQGLWDTFFQKKREWFGLTSDLLVTDILSLTTAGLGRLMQSNEIPNAFKEAMAPEDAKEVTSVLEPESDNDIELPEEEAESEPGNIQHTAVSVSRKKLKRAMKKTKITGRGMDTLFSVLQKQGVSLEEAHSVKDKIILERWRKMAGICKDRE